MISNSGYQSKPSLKIVVHEPLIKGVNSSSKKKLKTTLHQRQQLIKKEKLRRVQDQISQIYQFPQKKYENRHLVTNASTIENQPVNYRAQIITTLEEQNKNLKEQNKFLYEKLNEMKKRQRLHNQIEQKKATYKQLYMNTLIELQSVKTQSIIAWEEAQAIKEETLLNLQEFQKDLLRSSQFFLKTEKL